jgi:hypothetical protein
MLGKSGKLGILTGSGKDLGITGGDRPPTLALKRTGDDCCPAGLGSGAHELVDEVDELVWEANGDLLAHPIMVPDWYQHAAVRAAQYAASVTSPEEPVRAVDADDDHAVRDPLAVPEAVIDARRRPMSERLELALSWNTVASELRAGLAAVTGRSKPKP